MMLTRCSGTDAVPFSGEDVLSVAEQTFSKAVSGANPGRLIVVAMSASGRSS